MLFIQKQDKELFAPNGIWGRRCYVMSDDATKRRLKWLYRGIVVSMLVLLVGAALVDSWWVLGSGIGVLVLIQMRASKHICRDCEVVEENLSLASFIEEYARTRKPLEIWTVVIACSGMAVYQGWKLYTGSEEPLWETLALGLFGLLSAAAVYAVIVKKQALV